MTGRIERCARAKTPGLAGNTETHRRTSVAEVVTKIKVELESEEYCKVVKDVSDNFAEIQRLLQLNADLLVDVLKSVRCKTIKPD